MPLFLLGDFPPLTANAKWSANGLVPNGHGLALCQKHPRDLQKSFSSELVHRTYILRLLAIPRFRHRTAWRRRSGPFHFPGTVFAGLKNRPRYRGGASELNHPSSGAFF
jgi:hypothetical protein